jgi:hypothetical protein
MAIGDGIGLLNLQLALRDALNNALSDPLTGLAGGTPVSKVSSWSGNDSAAYHDVVSWTVGAGKTGELSEIGLISNNLPKTYWRLSIAGVEQFTDLILQFPVSQPFPRGNRLAAGEVVLVQAKSVDGATVNAQGTIVGSER